MGLVAPVEAVHLDRNLIDFFAVVLLLKHCIVNHRVVRPTDVGVLDLRGTRGFLELCILLAQLGVLFLQLSDVLYLSFRGFGLVALSHHSKPLFFRFGEKLSYLSFVSHLPLLLSNRFGLLLLLFSFTSGALVGLVLTSLGGPPSGCFLHPYFNVFRIALLSVTDALFDHCDDDELIVLRSVL